MNKFLAIVLFLKVVSVSAQTDEPLSLTKRIFGKDKFSQLNKYIDGEYKGHPNGTDIPASVSREYTLLQQDEKTAVVNITLRDSSGYELDTYLHFVKHKVWRAIAWRALAFTGIIAQVKDELEKMTPMQIDSIINQTKNDSTRHILFKSREEYQFELGNATLTLASDRDLISHFRKNEAEFERLKELLLSRDIMSKRRGVMEIKRDDSVHVEMRKLLLHNVSPEHVNDSTQYLNFNIGGMIDNTVGYFYIENAKDVPKMHPNRLIMLRELGKGWYLYKTT